MSDLETQRLFALARDKTAAGRQALAATVTDLFSQRGDMLTDRERALMSEILRQLIEDVEVSVRRGLAEQLARQPDAPRDLIRALANDEIAVAHAILQHSTVLQDEELIEIIQHRTLEHQLAVAVRSVISEGVSDALVGTGQTEIVKTLLENHGARISQATMAYLVEQSKRVDSYQNPLLRRPELPVELASRMYWWVSAALRKHITENFPVSQHDLDDALEATVRGLATGPGEPRRSVQLAERLAGEKAVSPALLVQTLRQGEIALFEAMFAKLTGIRLTLIRRLLFERGGEGLAVACRAIGIEAPIFASIYLLSRRARPYDAPPARGEVKRILSFYEEMSPEAAGQLLRKWQRNPEYLKAVWQIDQSRRRHATR